MILSAPTWFLLVHPCLIWVPLCDLAGGEVFTATSDLHNLIATEKRIINIVRNSIEVKHKRLAVQSYIRKFSRTFNVNNTDLELLVSQPLNAFRLIKHLTMDWDDLIKLIRQDLNSTATRQIDILRQSMRLSGEDDLKGAASACVRLQSTYNIDTEAFASGNISGMVQVRGLDTFECQIIGRLLALQGEFDYAVSWLEVARNKVNNHTSKRMVTHEAAILDWLVYSYYHSGNTFRAHDLLLELQVLNPDYPNLDANIKKCRDLLDKLSVTEVEAMKQTQPRLKFGGESEALCRGEGMLAPNITAKLKCFYVTQGNPFLYIQPAKYEAIHHNPEIFILHEVALNSQLQTIKALAATSMKRSATIVGKSVGQLKSRISKSAFLNDHLDLTTKKVNNYLGYITKLDMLYSEYMQVVNYGIGGHYVAHHDYFGNNINKYGREAAAHLGDRIATVLVYMTDVQAGGATIFPHLNLTIFPEKGSAVFWWNLHRDGQGDNRTLHEGCPVLSGNKWVMNKWVRVLGQDKARPCDVSY